MPNSSYDIFLQHVEEAQQKYPKLAKVQLPGDDFWFLRGDVEIVDKVNGKLWETYTVEIRHREGYPKRFPAVYEVSGKIPQLPDWHINPDGSCCIKVWPDEILTCVKGFDLIKFIEGDVLPYFYNQTHRKVEGFYVNGERAHGVEGILEYYSEQLRTNGDTERTVELLSFIATQSKPSRKAVCFCGKRKMFRKCHKDTYEKLILIGRENILEHIKLFSANNNQLG
jgi:hypothetical protein